MQVEIRTGFRKMARILRDDREFRRAAARMPRPVPWDWAKPRLMPLLAQPCIDLPGEERIRTAADLGPAIEFGIDLCGHFPIVDRVVAERWECTSDQLRAAALANLERRAATVPTSAVQTAVMSGRRFGMLRSPAGCASSILLAPDHLRRLFGGQDQMLAAPGRHTLVSFSLDVPELAAAEIAIDLELDELTPLFLAPFYLIGGELLWDEPGDIDAAP